MKKILSILLAVLLTSTAVFADGMTVDDNAALPEFDLESITKSNPFTDVKESDWFCSGVNFAYKNGIMSGTDEGVFSPYESLTRAMMITMLYRKDGSPESAAADFSDVLPGSWYEKAVGWGNEKKIVSGTGEKTFSPTDSITREQLAVMLYNYAKATAKNLPEKGDLATFADYSDVSEWAAEAMGYIVGAGIIGGSENNSLLPKNTATRAEAAVMLSRFFSE